MCIRQAHLRAGERKEGKLIFISISVCACELLMVAVNILAGELQGFCLFHFTKGHPPRPCTLPIQKLETKTETIETEVEPTPHPQPLSTEKVLQETVLVEERHVMNVHASGDASHTARDDVDATESAPADRHSGNGKEGSSVTEAAKEQRGEEADKSAPEQEQPATVSQEEDQVSAIHSSEGLEQKSHFEVSGHYSLPVMPRFRSELTCS